MTFRSREDNVYWVDGCKKKDPEEYKNLKIYWKFKEVCYPVAVFWGFWRGSTCFPPFPHPPIPFHFCSQTPIPWLSALDVRDGWIVGRGDIRKGLTATKTQVSNKSQDNLGRLEQRKKKYVHRKGIKADRWTGRRTNFPAAAVTGAIILTGVN